MSHEEKNGSLKSKLKNHPERRQGISANAARVSRQEEEPKFRGQSGVESEAGRSGGFVLAFELLAKSPSLGFAH